MDWTIAWMAFMIFFVRSFQLTCRKEVFVLTQVTKSSLGHLACSFGQITTRRGEVSLFCLPALLKMHFYRPQHAFLSALKMLFKNREHALHRYDNAGKINMSRGNSRQMTLEKCQGRKILFARKIAVMRMRVSDENCNFRYITCIFQRKFVF